MKKCITAGSALILLLTFSTINSSPTKADDAQYTGDIIILLIIGKYTTAQHQLHYPYMNINLSCKSGEVIITGFVWYKPPGYASPVPEFIFENNLTYITISKFIGICRLHHVVGIGI